MEQKKKVCIAMYCRMGRDEQREEKKVISTEQNIRESGKSILQEQKERPWSIGLEIK